MNYRTYLQTSMKCFKKFRLNFSFDPMMNSCTHGTLLDGFWTDRDAMFCTRCFVLVSKDFCVGTMRCFNCIALPSLPSHGRQNHDGVWSTYEMGEILVLWQINVAINLLAFFRTFIWIVASMTWLTALANCRLPSATATWNSNLDLLISLSIFQL